MNADAGGWLWLVIDVFFVAIFAAALAYGTIMWRRRRNPEIERRRDEATDRLYHRSSNE
jgi:hypothetical protein